MTTPNAWFFLIPFFLVRVWGQVTLNPFPTRVIGQNSLQSTNVNPNLVEGREFFNPQGIALDTSMSPPGLYVSDSGNNRVLGFRSATGFANGQHADVVIGQVDYSSTLAEGPQSGRTVTTGLDVPTGLATDAQGNLYVVDSNNNRILRFPRPFSQSGQILPDLLIGQTGFSAGAPNQGSTLASASSLSFTTSGASAGSLLPLTAFIVFDPTGNLWVADAGNNRVLRFNANALGEQAASGPAADLVLGQNDLISNGYNPTAGANPAASLSSFTTPTGIAFDAAGRLFVEESISARRGRILVFAPPFYTGGVASRLLGVDLSNPQPPVISEFQLNGSPGGIFQIGASIGVADTLNSRILVFPPVEQWTPGTTFQAAIEVAGQADFAGGTFNRGQPAAGAATLSFPGAAVFFGDELYVADSQNHRVTVLPQSGSSFGPATRVLGQDAFDLNTVNLVEGREFDFTNIASGGADTGMAVDLNSNPPHLYVSDTYNNRILGFFDLRNLQAGARADLVIGQPDFQRTLINYPGNNASAPNASGLDRPIGLIVDPAGNLYVADAGNSRVLRFPQPFANYNPGTLEPADLVLGQSSFTGAKITDATERTLSAPYGIALTNDPGLLVSDVNKNRVLYFKGASADLRSGMSAAMVFGQPDFTSGDSGSGPGQLNAPHHISSDLEDRLYVADTNNARVSIWDTVPRATLGEPAAQQLTSGLSGPRGMYVSPATNDIWVGDGNTGQAIRYPPFDALQRNGVAPNAVITDALRPVAVVQDAWGDLFIGDAGNRIVVHYRGLGAVNAASFLSTNVLAPGMITSLFAPQGNTNQFGGQADSAPAFTFPLPSQLNGLQVLFNNSPVPLFYADSNQINFQVPAGAPVNGIGDLQVIETATGRVLGDTLVRTNSVMPGLFSLTGNGIGTVAAINVDGTVNGPTNPAVQGQVITLFGTGQGFVPGAPADGFPATAVQTTRPPSIIIGTEFVTSDAVLYSGLAPGLVGVWQINVTIPKDVITTPTNPTYVIVQQDSVFSGSPSTGRAIQIYVKART